MKVQFVLACCLAVLRSPLLSEPVTPLEVVTPRVQFIKFWAEGYHHCIPIYGNVVVGKEYIYDSHPLETTIIVPPSGSFGGTTITLPSEEAARLRSAGETVTEASHVKAEALPIHQQGVEQVKNELLAKMALGKDSQLVYTTELDGLMWHDLYNLDPSQGLNVLHSPDGKGVITWIDEFKHHINAIQKTLEAMPADLQVLIYQQILKQISDNLPNNTVFTRALETKIDADFQGKIDQLQAEIDILKSKIH